MSIKLFVYCTALKRTSRNQSIPSHWSFARADDANNADDQIIDEVTWSVTETGVKVEFKKRRNNQTNKF